MRGKLRCGVLFAVFVAAVQAAPHAGPAPADPALARVQTRTFDELYWRAGSDLSTYRRILLDAPRAEFTRDWLRSMNESRGAMRRLEPTDAAQVAEGMASAMREAITRALLAQGYEIVTTAAPGVLRLSPSIADLYVNAPYVPMAGIEVGVVHREAGEATMRLEISDAATGTALARIVDHEVARTGGGYERATSVSNLFWFEAMFGRWADDCVRQIRAGAPRP